MVGETDENWHSCIRKTLELEPDSVTIYQMELPHNTTISRDLLTGTGQFGEGLADLDHEAPLGGGSLRRPGRRRLSPRQRLHRGQGSLADPLRLPGPSLAGGRPGRAGGGVVRPRQRRAHAELRPVGDLQRRGGARRDPAQPRLPAHGRGTDDPGAGAAAQARVDPAGVFRGEVRRRRARALPRADRVAGRRGISRGGRPGPGGPVAQKACCVRTSCCGASSCPSTPGSATHSVADPALRAPHDAPRPVP